MSRFQVRCGSWKFIIIATAIGTMTCEATIVGDVTFGNGNKIAISSLINAGSGKTELGNGNNVDENAAILNLSCGLSQSIGNGNIFEANSTCESLSVGNGNIFEEGSLIGMGIILGNGNTVQAGCHKTGNAIYTSGITITCP